MWFTILIISIVVLVSCLVLIAVLNFKEKLLQQAISRGDATLCISTDNINKKSSEEIIEKINDRINFIHNSDELQDYSVEIELYKNYISILEKTGGSSDRANRLRDLIKLLKERTNHYLENNRINQESKNVRYKLNIDDNIDNLVKIYENQEESVIHLVNQKFPGGQLTNTKFMGEIENWNRIFTENSESLNYLLNLDPEYSEKYKNEINDKLQLLKRIINKLRDLEVELAVNMNKNKTDDDEIKVLFEDMKDLINSIKDYN